MKILTLLLLLAMANVALGAPPTQILTLQIPTGGGSNPNGSLEIMSGATETIDVGAFIVNNGTATGFGSSGTVTTFSAGALSPLFTTAVANPTSTPSLTFTLSNAGQNTFLAGPSSGGSGAPSYRAMTLADLPSGTGTVTSVGMSVPSFLSIAGSPITTSGTLALTYSGTALPAANGGTGQTSLTSGYLLEGNGTGPVNLLNLNSATGSYFQYAANGPNGFFAADGNGNLSLGGNTISTSNQNRVVIKFGQFGNALAIAASGGFGDAALTFNDASTVPYIGGVSSATSSDDATETFAEGKVANGQFIPDVNGSLEGGYGGFHYESSEDFSTNGSTTMTVTATLTNGSATATVTGFPSYGVILAGAHVYCPGNITGSNQYIQNGTTVSSYTSPTLVLSQTAAASGSFTIYITSPITFVGTITNGSPTVTITTQPFYGNIFQGALLTSTGSGIPSSTTATATVATGGTSLTMSANATASGSRTFIVTGNPLGSFRYLMQGTTIGGANSTAIAEDILGPTTVGGVPRGFFFDNMDYSYGTNGTTPVSMLHLQPVASAVNGVTISPATTTNAPSIAATGSDTNISLNLVSKGSGTVNVNGTPIGTGSGTVTSVTFTGDGIVDSSTPSTAVTTSGTVTATAKTQTANTVLAGPSSGSAVAPTFRSLVSADIPSLSSIYLPLTGGTLTGSLAIDGSITSSIPNSTASFIAYSPASANPQCEFQIGNTTSDLNAGLVLADKNSSSGTQIPSFVDICTDKTVTDSAEKDTIFYQTASLATLATQGAQGSGTNGTPLTITTRNIGGSNGIYLGVGSTVDAFIGPSPVDNGYQLEVNGTTKFDGAVTGSSTATFAGVTDSVSGKTLGGAIEYQGAGTLSSGTATFTVPSGAHPIVMDTNTSSLTNVGSIAVSVSGTTATVKSSNALDTSTFNYYY